MFNIPIFYVFCKNQRVDQLDTSQTHLAVKLILLFQEFIEVIDQTLGLCDLLLFEQFSQCAPQRLPASDTPDPLTGEEADCFREFLDEILYLDL
jgi:hypothetical protein